MSTALGVIGTGYPRPARPALLVGESPLPVGTAARLGETARRLAPQAEVELARDPGILGGATRSRTRGDARSVMVSGRADVTTVRLCASPGSRTSAGDRPGHGRRARSRPPRGTGALAGPATATLCAPGAVAPPPPRSITRGWSARRGPRSGPGSAGLDRRVRAAWSTGNVASRRTGPRLVRAPRRPHPRARRSAQRS